MFKSMGADTDALKDALRERFTLDRELGRGGMATVLLAHDRRLDRKVAIKVFSPELSAALGHDRFEREIRLTARLVHPNIVPLFDSGLAAGRLFYVMPYLEGTTLRARLEADGRRPAAEVVRVLSDLGEALAYAHSLGIVHRDLKPENVFWYGERALLADFGIATASGGNTRLTGPGLVIGTLAYMSPEQASSEPVDGRSDLYALGCLSYELLTGRVPFDGPTVMAIIAAHLATPVPDVRDARPDVDPALARLITWLMAKVPRDRPDHAPAFLAALRELDGRGTAALPATAPPPPRTVPMSAPVRELFDKAVTLFLGAMQGGEGTRNKLDMAAVYLEKAHAAEPDNPLVLSRLSDVYHLAAVRGFADWDPTMRKVKEMRLRALSLDDTIGEVHSSLGVTFLYWEDDFDLAGEELALGARLAPYSADARRHLACWLKIAGRLHEALDEMRAAVQVSPRAPFMHVGLADVLMTMGRYDEAVVPLREALRQAPRYEAALERLEMACHRAGRHDEARDARRTLLGMRGDLSRMQQLDADIVEVGWVGARERDLRRELAAQLARAANEDPFLDVRGSRQLSDQIIITLADLGEWQQAMDWVERAYYRRPGRLRRVLTDLPYDHHGLASDPRYARLLRTAGLADLLR